MEQPSHYHTLSGTELLELDRLIDARVSSFELLRAGRRIALRAVLTAFDALVQNVAIDEDLTQRMVRYRGLYNSMDHAIRWVHEYCPATSEYAPYDSHLSALELLIEARSYCAIHVQMSLAFKGRDTISVSAPHRYIVSSTSEENQELETARSLIAAAEFPETAEDACNLPDDVADALKKQITIDRISGRQLLYSVSDETYQLAAGVMNSRRLYKFSMNPEWDLGGYTFADLERVWDTLKVLEALHQMALQKLPRQADRKRLNLKVRTQREWVNEIAHFSGLGVDSVDGIFTDLIYNPELHKSGRKKGHVMYQPFIDLGTDEIAQSNALVMMSAVEKCSWILTELLRPKTHSQLRNLKERFWIDNEFLGYASDRLKAFPHIKFKSASQGGDIDLLIYDDIDDYALVAQLKWTTSMDNTSGVESDDRQYATGVSQAERALLWAEDNRSELASRIGLPRGAFDHTTFRPIVIAKETLPSGTFSSPDVPVINEALFRWIMKSPHNATLKQLWETAKKADYLPKEGVHFKMHEPDPIEWGELEFRLLGVAYVPLSRRWDPAVDLLISEL